MSWIKSDLRLKGEFVELIPMTEEHFDVLFEMAEDRRIWEFLNNDMSTYEKKLVFFQSAMQSKHAGDQFPFVVYHQKEQKIIGSTRYMHVNQPHRSVEIGATWYHPNYWASVVNLECKMLLLTHAFEELKTIRVWLKTSVENIRSQKAIQKIGAKYEGVLRNEMIRDNGTYRSSAYFSIIDNEWSEVKENLQRLIEVKKGKA
jgi:RimJ/RimL family protein N-acetyltransferase